MPIKLSVTSKLDGIKSWSLTAVDDCPGAVARSYKGRPPDLVEACQGCYARDGNYRFANVKAPRLHNRADWKREDWEADMIGALAGETHFRWLDSGDLYALELAWKVYTVMVMTPWCQHWLPTRMYKFDKFAEVFAAMRELPNVALRFSSDSATGAFTPELHGSTIVASKATAPAGVHVCEAYEHGGKCSGCRVCWGPTPVVAYVAHGARMGKVIKLKLL
jgi:hypothetical protein